MGTCPVFLWDPGSPPGHAGAAKRTPRERLSSVVPPIILRGRGGAERFKRGWEFRFFPGGSTAWGLVVSCVFTVLRGWRVWAEWMDARMRECAHEACKTSVSALPWAPPPAYTLILFDRVETVAPPGQPEMKSSPPAKPRPRGSVQRGPLGGGNAAVPELVLTGPGAQKWWIDQIDEAGLVSGRWLSRRFWSEPGPGAWSPVALGLNVKRRW